jgi:hypothetical protein
VDLVIKPHAVDLSEGHSPAPYCPCSVPGMEPRTIARALAAGRLGFGVALVAAPALLARRWVGDDGDRPGAQVFATGLGARDLALAGGTLAALSRGGARPWLAACAAADLGDLVATLRAREDVPAVSVAAVALVAGGAAVAGAWLSAQDDW